MNKPKRSVYLATVKRVSKGKTYVSHPLRHTYREGGKVKRLTLGSLTDLPDDRSRSKSFRAIRPTQRRFRNKCSESANGSNCGKTAEAQAYRPRHAAFCP